MVVRKKNGEGDRSTYFYAAEKKEKEIREREREGRRKGGTLFGTAKRDR